MLCLCLLPLTSAPADEVRLEWMPQGFYAKTHYHVPKVCRFLPEKPAQIVKSPEGLVNPQYVLLETGPKSGRTFLGLILDQRSPKEARLWLDANGDGDLTNDPKVKWEFSVRSSGIGEIISWHGEAMAQIKYPEATQDMGLYFYRNGSSSGPGSLIYRRDYGRSGKISIGGQELAVFLSDDSTTGEFTAEHSKLCIDVNSDHHINPRTELFLFMKPLVLQGSVYEAKNLAPDGSRFEIIRSDKTPEQMRLGENRLAAVKVAEQRKAQEADLGKPAPSFEAKTIAGKTVRFPDDYKGKLVLLDFWATWCGPCLHELPELTRVHEDFAAYDFTVLGISLDHDEDVASLPEFVKSKKISWPQICDGGSWQGDIVKQYGVHGIPSCWLIDGNTGLVVATSVDLRGEALRGTVARALVKLGKNVPKDMVPAAGIPLAVKTPADDTSPSPLVTRTRALAAEDGLTSAEAFQALLDHPTAAAVKLEPPASAPLRGREIAKRAAEAHVRVGWVYQCTKCNRWHTNLAGGYAIAPDVVVTARHVVAAPVAMKPGTGHPVVVRGESDVLNIEAVLLADETGDTAVIRVSAKDLKPLALSRDVQVGDTAYCFSDPRDVIGHFSSGLVNRLHSPAIPGKPASPFQQRIDVSADWAPGSSGSAILDEYGNVIGHVARIRPLYGASRLAEPAGRSSAAPTVMTLNEAVPASVVLSLIEKKPQ
ncbi:redoxin domain-containing protein [Prosthecobacter sp.]|uniref:redoxin domain-containing protein n=1 Tax=Prosthecobacter sp. TaxID=1965333 RepID=UPI0025D11845|nr:redoxin domain-containing protein [Prosthecobacter sp.]